MPASTQNATAATDPGTAAPQEYDVAVIGAGPAGTAAALRAAELGAKVVVLEAGRVLEAGTHAELVALGGRYAELFELQAAGYR